MPQPPDDALSEGALRLTPQEEDVFRTLLGAAAHFGLGTTLRVAGGWVRDKLLGKECKDVDIALDDMLGREFAEKVKEYLELKGGEEVRGAHVIQANPDQSKHLETATMKVAGLELDLVNLRSEEYAEDSRIPEMKFGTAEEDALRRDLTINALFYNINTRTVEDLTGRGLDDLRVGVVRTPLPPRTTFLDDPLRVLRAVRFATRYGFAVDDALAEAAGLPEVRDALAQKVSRERFGVEINGMLKGPGPESAVRTMAQLGVLPEVFAAPGASPEWEVNAAVPGGGARMGEACAAAAEAAAAALGAWDTLLSQQDGGALSAEERRITALAAALLPLRAQTVRVKKKDVPLSLQIVAAGLKLRAQDGKDVAHLHAHAEAFAALLPQLEQGAGGNGSGALRVTVGKLVRACGPLWRASLLLGTVCAQGGAGVALPAGEAADCDSIGSGGGGGGDDAEAAARTCAEAAAIVVGMGLERAWEIKPLLDGRAIMAATGAKGKVVGEMSAAALEWQLARPDATKEEAEAWLLETYSAAPAQ